MDTATAAPASTEATAAETDVNDVDLYAMAEAADAGKPFENIATGQTPPNNAPGENNNGQPAEQGQSAPPAKSGQQPPAKDAKPGEQGKPGEQQQQPKPGEESAFTKAQKDAARKDRSWQALEQEKAEFRAERSKLDAELAQLRSEVQQLRTRPAAPAGPAKDEHGIDAATYDKLAKSYDEQGNAQLAEAAKAKAAALRAKEQAAPAPSAAPSGEPWKAPEFQAQWKANADAIVAKEPELGNPEHPIFKAVNQLVSNPQWSRFFLAHPDGIRAAVEVAKLQAAATELPALRGQLDTAKAEIARLTKLTAPNAAPPGAPAPGAKRPEDMSDADIRALAAAADAGGS